MSELIYTFASLAARCEGGATCRKGMRLLADTLHPHGVKITWIVSPESARAAADDLTRWHETFGDGVAVHPPAVNGACLAGSLEEKKRCVGEARDAIAKALPWARLTVAGGCHTDPEIPAVLEDLGFEGLWGFCWEQIEVDQITDRGCPWGMYYMDRGERLRPARGRGVAAMEWTARDLLKSFHSGNPCLYSTDPNDVARGGLCSWNEIRYWKDLADNYLRNIRYNDRVFLQQHQEAHEMECSERFRCYTEEDAREAAVMLDAFAAYIKDSARMMTLDEAAAFYRREYAFTPSSYMLWEDAPTPPFNPDYAWSTPRGPWPKTFLYYDRDAQMVFIEGKVEPVCLRNYSRPWKSGEYFAESYVPRTRLIRNTQYTWSREIELRVASPGPIPYGVALWGDYSLYQIDDVPTVPGACRMIEGKILSRDLLFLRYDLVAGDNTLVIKLQGK